MEIYKNDLFVLKGRRGAFLLYIVDIKTENYANKSKVMCEYYEIDSNTYTKESKPLYLISQRLKHFMFLENIEVPDTEIMNLRDRYLEYFI